MEGSEAQLLASLRAQARALHKLEPLQEDPTIEPETVEHEEVVSTSSKGPITSAVTATNLFRHPDTHPIVLDLVMLRKYGPEWMLCEPEVLFLRIEQDFKAQLSELNISKLMALKTLHLVDSFWERWEVFNWCTAAFNSLFPDFELMQVPTVAQCAVAVDIANRIRDDMDWSSEVRAFIRSVFLHDQIAVSQPPLDFVKVNPEEFGLDVKDILERWPAVKKSEHAPEGASLDAIQLNRMWVVQHYLELSRSRLRIQLNLVPHV